ncbi:MAG: glycosyltransferase family 39 protein, partial [Armatimonadota bacterium]|nr:glycosyltransferase family 39 protein [Armatimonadota bacterium]
LDVPYPFPLDYGEGVALDRCVGLLHGEPLYPAVGRPPFITWNFPPLYMWVCALAARAVGPSFAVGRTVSLLAALAAAVLVGLLASRGGVSRFWAVVAGLLFVGTCTVATWGALMRVDMLGVAFGLVGLVCVASRRPAWQAGTAFGLAFLCKQSLFAALAASLLWLAHSRRWREGLWVAAVGGLVGGGVLALLWLVVGPPLWTHLFTANMNDWSVRQLVWETLRFGRGAAVLGVMVAAGWAAAPRCYRPGLPACYLLCAAAAGLLAGKAGAGDNYFLDITAALAIAGAGGAENVVRALSARGRAARGVALAAVLLVAHVALAAPFRQAGWHPRTPYLRAAAPLLISARAPVVSDDPGLVVAVGKRLWFQPFEFTQMAVAGKWDQSPMLDALRRGEVPLIAIHFNAWDPSARDAAGTWESGAFTDEMVQAIRGRYRPTHRAGPLWILQPAPP